MTIQLRRAEGTFYKCPSCEWWYLDRGVTGLTPLPPGDVISQIIIAEQGSIIISDPGSDFRKVTNLYIEPSTGKLIVIHEP